MATITQSLMGRYIVIDVVAVGVSDLVSVPITVGFASARPAGGLVGVRQFGATLTTAGGATSITPSLGTVDQTPMPAQLGVELDTATRDALVWPEPVLLIMSSSLLYLRCNAAGTPSVSSQVDARIILDTSP